MITYRVYYATEYTRREFDKDIFVVVEAANRIAALRKAFDLRPQAILWGMIEESPMYLELTPEAETPHSAPKQAQIEANDLIQVSFWQTGERAGKFSQQPYRVIARENGWVTYEIAPGKQHTVKADRTRQVEGVAA